MTGAHANVAHTAKGKSSAPDDCRSLAFIARQRDIVRRVLSPSMARLWMHYVDTRADVKIVETGPAHRERGFHFAVVVEDTDFWLGAYPTRDFAADAARRLGCRPSTRVL